MIKRDTADAYIQAVCERAAAINAGPYAYTITRIEVFGSYNTDKAVLGDIDLMVTKSPRYPDTEQQVACCEERRKVAHAAGRRFSPTWLDAYWPEEEVDRLLRGKKYNISIHHDDERPQLVEMGATFQVIYDRG